jgi:hypothetical protein
MLFNVPQYIDVEDKIAGPLTAKQLFWMIGMGAVLMILWSILDVGGFYSAAVPVVCIFAAMAFYRPYGQPLIVFIRNALLFFIRPKLYMWDRPTRVLSQKKVKNPESLVTTVNKNITAEDVSRLAKIVDNPK